MSGYSDIRDPDTSLPDVWESRFGSLFSLVRRLADRKVVTEVEAVVEADALVRRHEPLTWVARGSPASGLHARRHQLLVVQVRADELDRLETHPPEAVGAIDVLAVLGATAVHRADELSGHTT